MRSGTAIRRGLTGAAVVMAFAGLSGCGDDPAPSTSGTTGPSAVATTEPAVLEEATAHVTEPPEATVTDDLDAQQACQQIPGVQAQIADVESAQQNPDPARDQAAARAREIALEQAHSDLSTTLATLEDLCDT